MSNPKIKIGVISDTHIPLSANKIPDEIFKHFEGVDLILHAGDLIELSVLDELRKMAPVEAVYGNMDSLNVKTSLQDKKIIKAGKFSIGLTHGTGSPLGLNRRVKRAFSDDKIDVLVFGHSHRPVNKKEGGVLLFNPGSPTDQFFAPYRSCGILEIGKEVKGRIIRLS